MSMFQMMSLNQRYGDKVALKVYLDPEVITYDELCYLTVLHMGFDGCLHVGELIIHKVISEEVLQIFKELYQIRFPIEKIRLMSDYGYSDELAMIDNNSSAFNFRRMTNEKIKKNDLVYQIFKRYGWIWGGDWTSKKDYQHFEKLFDSISQG